jgi:protoporphyrinogen oxidase
MKNPHVILLGAGPAGLGAAFRLATRDIRATVLEANSFVGGNASSFEIAGLDVDFGSHRLHPSCDPNVMRDIRAFLGDDLLDQPRHGRIRLRGRWIHFPLKPLDLALRLPPTFAFGVLRDLALKMLPRRDAPGAETFATVLEAGLGATICHDFYFPYARKVWGIAPEKLSVTQARRRVGASSLGKMARKVLTAIPGLKPQGSGRFFYPRRGFGQISRAYADAAVARGANILLGARVQSVEIENQTRRVRFERDGQTHTLETDHIWSTIPITALAKIIQPRPPQAQLDAAEKMMYRAMILIYLIIEQEQFSEYDAHYFPETHIRISRMSEPKNYSSARAPANATVLCAELPCMQTDPEWQMSDDALEQVMRASLDAAGIPLRAPVRQVITRRLRQAYPIYTSGYEEHFDQLDAWLDRVDGLLTFGRQGLFAHDNTHHALFMAYAAAECLANDGAFDRARWHAFRREFETHVVED